MDHVRAEVDRLAGDVERYDRLTWTIAGALARGHTWDQVLPVVRPAGLDPWPLVGEVVEAFRRFGALDQPARTASQVRARRQAHLPVDTAVRGYELAADPPDDRPVEPDGRARRAGRLLRRAGRTPPTPPVRPTPGVEL